ncbi:MAG: carboxypeptidase regulatory-like domain-containing protein [Planctomycetaceae bacterium]|nr:carboxypeptidase regulatory-like domain-containing protein [Planctomycetaceae bacterium]
MKLLRNVTHAAVVLACCGLLMPQGAIAGPPAAAKSHRDITLSATGMMSGNVVNSQGQPLDGAIVSVQRGGQELAKTVSDAQGNFRVAGMKSGVYEVAVGQQVVPVRCWTAEIAPPASQTQATFVVGPTVRGQEYVDGGYCPPDYCPPGGMMGLDLITLWTVGASTGALVLTAINQADLNKIQKKIDQCCSP